MTKIVEEYKGILDSQKHVVLGKTRREIFETCDSFPSRFLSLYDTGPSFNSKRSG